MAPPRRRHSTPTPLIEDLVEEILLRVPPEEPAHLVRKGLVCKAWRRILSDRGFLRRYRAFHRAPPLLGYIRNLHCGSGPIPRFVPTSTPSPFSPTAVSGECQWWTLDCRHGRVLILTFTPGGPGLVVWDPITGHQKNLISQHDRPYGYFSGAVLCAADGCDHLDCHDGPFRVAIVETTSTAGGGHAARASVYSSETGAWSASTASIDVDYNVDGKPCLLIGDVLYFTLRCGGMSILTYHLGRHRLSVINTPRIFKSIAIEAEDGSLGVVAVVDNCIHLLSQRDGANGSGGGWARHRAIELEALIPERVPSSTCEVVGYVEGTDTIFVSTAAGIFAL